MKSNFLKDFKQVGPTISRLYEPPKTQNPGFTFRLIVSLSDPIYFTAIRWMPRVLVHVRRKYFAIHSSLLKLQGFKYSKNVRCFLLIYSPYTVASGTKAGLFLHSDRNYAENLKCSFNYINYLRNDNVSVIHHQDQSSHTVCRF